MGSGTALEEMLPCSVMVPGTVPDVGFTIRVCGVMINSVVPKVPVIALFVPGPNTRGTQFRVTVLGSRNTERAAAVPKKCRCRVGGVGDHQVRRKSVEKRRSGGFGPAKQALKSKDSKIDVASPTVADGSGANDNRRGPRSSPHELFRLRPLVLLNPEFVHVWKVTVEAEALAVMRIAAAPSIEVAEMNRPMCMFIFVSLKISARLWSERVLDNRAFRNPRMGCSVSLHPLQALEVC